MRKIKNHEIAKIPATLEIVVTDKAGAGGANHEYKILSNDIPHKIMACIEFQNGPIKEHGVNGVTQEALLAIVADRLASFQAGKYACAENGIALRCVLEALAALKQRTLSRYKRGVEGTSKK
jgi:hypothetical protein